MLEHRRQWPHFWTNYAVMNTRVLLKKGMDSIMYHGSGLIRLHTEEEAAWNSGIDLARH